MIERVFLTVQGRRLWALNQTGVGIHYTKMQIGDGYLSQGQNITQLTSLVHPVRDLVIADIASSGPLVSVSAQITNADQTTGFYFREVGVWAQDPDYGEILYAVGNAGDKADEIPPPDVMRVDYVFAVELTIDNADKVSFEPKPSLIFLTRDDMTEMGDPNLTFSDCASATVDELESGSKLSLLVGKIKRLLSDLVNFRGRPEGFATKAQGDTAEDVERQIADFRREIDCGSFTDDPEIAAHNASAFAHPFMSVDGNVDGTSEADSLQAHVTDQYAHPNLTVDGNTMQGGY